MYVHVHVCVRVLLMRILMAWSFVIFLTHSLFLPSYLCVCVCVCVCMMWAGSGHNGDHERVGDHTRRNRWGAHTTKADIKTKINWMKIKLKTEVVLRLLYYLLHFNYFHRVFSFVKFLFNFAFFRTVFGAAIDAHRRAGNSVRALVSTKPHFTIKYWCVTSSFFSTYQYWIEVHPPSPNPSITCYRTIAHTRTCLQFFMFNSLKPPSPLHPHIHTYTHTHTDTHISFIIFFCHHLSFLPSLSLHLLPHKHIYRSACKTCTATN